MRDEESQRRLAAHFRVLAESSHQFAAISGVSTLLEAVVQRLGEVIGDGCSVWVPARGGRQADLTAAYHPDPIALAASRALVAEQPLRAEESMTARVIATGQAILVPRIDPANVAERLRPILEKMSVSSVLIVPLRAHERILGAVTLIRSSAAPPYTSDDQELAQDIADRAGLAIENTLLVVELERTNAALRRSESRHRRLAESGVIGIVASSMAGRILEANDAFLAMTGYSREDLAAGRLTSAVFILPEQRAEASSERERLRPGGVASPSERELVRKDGSRFHALIGGARVEDGNEEIIAFVLDLSEQKRAEARARGLADQAAESASLRRENDAAQEAHRELESFSYSVAHDLRTPLRGINGFITALVEDHGDVLDPSAKDLVDRVTASTRQMSDLIDALLGLAQLSRAEIDWQLVDLATIARGVVDQLHAAEPRRCVVLVAPQRLETYGDPRLLRALLENVLGNAWKFTRDRPEARIELFVTEDTAGRCVHVRDNGVGFDMAYFEKLFVPFQRLHTRAEFDGSGVGLATVERIVRRHGGAVSAEGAVDRGATISFTLPPPPVAR